MDKLLTVVVPVYKVEKYINKCLDSLIVPDELMDQLEVIVVNDGTPDQSAEMARVYEKKYPGTFRVIDKENGGHGSAFNVGLKETKGKFVRFLDSDDWFDTSNLVNLIKCLYDCDADIIFGDVNRFYAANNSNIKSAFPQLPVGELLNADSFDWNLLGGGEGKASFHYATYKTMMLQPHFPLFLEKQSYDDAILFVAPIIFSKRLIYYPGVIYNYLIGREGQSISKGTMITKYRDMELVIKSQINLVKESMDVSYNKQLRLSSIISTMIMKHWERLSFLPYRKSKEEIKKWDEYLQTEHINYKKSKKMLLYKYVPFCFYWPICKIVH